MITATPLLIATLPGRSVEECRAQIVVARESGADLAEVRFDRWATSELDRARELFPSSLPLVATYRSQDEGGEAPSDARRRAPVLSRLAGLGFRFIDLEAERDWTAEFPAEGAEFIASRHLRGVPSQGRLGEFLRHPPSSAALSKVVVPATLTELFDRVVPEIPGPGVRPFILHTTGPSGPLSRAWGRRFGSFAVYGSLPSSDPAVGPGAVEPAQLRVDRLRSYFAHEPPGPLFAVVGRPISHSASPDLHHRWMVADGRAGLYMTLEVRSEEELARSVPHLIAGGFRGLNVTHPWKASAASLADRVEPSAQACACANTLTFRSGSVIAENTDLAAAMRRLTELRETGQWTGESLTVVGAGGAARACLAAAVRLGARLRVMARDANAARSVARDYGAEVVDPANPRPNALVVHATTAGRSAADRLEVPFGSLIGPGTHVVDYVYAPATDEVRSTALAAQATYEDGWRLLVYQAAEAFRVWWGSGPGEDGVRRAVEERPRAA